MIKSTYLLDEKVNDNALSTLIQILFYEAYWLRDGQHDDIICLQ